MRCHKRASQVIMTHTLHRQPYHKLTQASWACSRVLCLLPELIFGIGRMILIPIFPTDGIDTRLLLDQGLHRSEGVRAPLWMPLGPFRAPVRRVYDSAYLSVCHGF